MKGNDILQTMDARDWAAEFREIHPKCGISEDVLIAWFANAIMCGWDHRHFASREYKKSVSRALFPWWSWKRYVAYKPGRLAA